MGEINHFWLDEIGTWSAALKIDTTVAAEFEALRKVRKLGRSQWRRIQHLEKHLDAGDVLCKCYEEGRFVTNGQPNS